MRRVGAVVGGGLTGFVHSTPLYKLIADNDLLTDGPVKAVWEKFFALGAEDRLSRAQLAAMTAGVDLVAGPLAMSSAAAPSDMARLQHALSD
jgi:hypothetical protein